MPTLNWIGKDAVVNLKVLDNLPVPLPDPATINEIGDLVLQANRLRDEAWQMERGAIGRIEEMIGGSQRADTGSLLNARSASALSVAAEDFTDYGGNSKTDI